MSTYNPQHHSVKRILREVKEFQNDKDTDLHAGPISDDIFEWHFTMRGPPDSEFEGGIYHGRIILPLDYPLKPPDIIILTPSGRFKPGKKICLSNSSYHPENWQPAWSIRTALIALRGFMPSPAKGAVGSMDSSKERRIQLAVESINWKCDLCNISNCEILPKIINNKETQTEEAETEIDNETNNKTEANNEYENEQIERDITIDENENNINNEEENQINEEIPRVVNEIRNRRVNEIINNPNIRLQGQGQIQVVEISPMKLNIILTALISLLLFLLYRRYG